MKKEKISDKRAKNIANWIVQTVLKLPTDELIQFYNLITNELSKRGVI